MSLLFQSLINKPFKLNFKYNIPFVINELLKFFLFVFTIVTILVYSNYIVIEHTPPATKWALKHNPEFLSLFWMVTFIYHNILNHIITKYKKPFIPSESLGYIILLVFVSAFLFYRYPNPFSLLFIILFLMIIIRFYHEKANWFKKYEFYNNKLGKIDDLMSNSEYVFHYDLLTTNQVSELLVIKDQYFFFSEQRPENYLRSEIEDWEASALCYISRKNPTLFFETIDKLNIQPDCIYESGFNQPFMRVINKSEYLTVNFLEIYITKKKNTQLLAIDSLKHINWSILCKSSSFDNPGPWEIDFIVGLYRMRRCIPKLDSYNLDVLLCKVIKVFPTEIHEKLPLLFSMEKQTVDDAFNIGLASYSTDPFSRNAWIISEKQMENPQIFNAYKSWLVHWITRNESDFRELPKYITQNKNCLDIYNTISSSK